MNNKERRIMKKLIFSIFLFILSPVVVADVECKFIEKETYWFENAQKCLSNCVFPYKHNVNIFLNGENNIGATKSSSSTDSIFGDRIFEDYKINGDYYDLSKGEKIYNGFYELCMEKKSKRHKRKIEQLESEEELKKTIRSIPMFFKNLLIGSMY